MLLDLACRRTCTCQLSEPSSPFRREKKSAVNAERSAVHCTRVKPYERDARKCSRSGSSADRAAFYEREWRDCRHFISTCGGGSFVFVTCQNSPTQNSTQPHNGHMRLMRSHVRSKSQKTHRKTTRAPRQARSRRRPGTRAESRTSAGSHGRALEPQAPSRPAHSTAFVTRHDMLTQTTVRSHRTPAMRAGPSGGGGACEEAAHPVSPRRLALSAPPPCTSSPMLLLPPVHLLASAPPLQASTFSSLVFSSLVVLRLDLPRLLRRHHDASPLRVEHLLVRFRVCARG